MKPVEGRRQDPFGVSAVGVLDVCWTGEFLRGSPVLHLHHVKALPGCPVALLLVQTSL